MAPFGKVLDLFDDRYLDLQDVVGNVEPFPTVVPYEEYNHNILVYRVDTSEEIYMALMQDFTDRKARGMNKELWTWCVQWEIEANQNTAQSPPSKKPRLDLQQLGTSPSLKSPLNLKTPQRKAPIIDIIERRVIRPQTMRKEDMLRILIDIVQVESTVVPNFIEFLYRWIDFFEGDGTALKAAMRWEIPSLWEFDYNPLVLDDVTRPNASSPKKETSKEHIREKPDLAAFEEQIEHSERLKYREVHYGIKLPKLWEPVPPLINLPRDREKRTKYYAACFKSRQRAFNLLIEAGITAQQIRNYKKRQPFHPRETAQEGHGEGLIHYQKDAKAAQTRYFEKETEMATRVKHMEIAISNKLAFEAKLAVRSNNAEGASGFSLIPATKPQTARPKAATERRRGAHPKQNVGEERNNNVPNPLVPRMKGKLLRAVIDSDRSDTLQGADGISPKIRWDCEDGNLSSAFLKPSEESSGGNSEQDSYKSGRYTFLGGVPVQRAVLHRPVLHEGPMPSSASTHNVNPMFNTTPAVPSSESMEVDVLEALFTNHPNAPFPTTLEQMQVLTRAGTLFHSVADNKEHWNQDEITEYITTLTPPERRRVLQFMRPLYNATLDSHIRRACFTSLDVGGTTDGASTAKSFPSPSTVAFREPTLLGNHSPYAPVPIPQLRIANESAASQHALHGFSCPFTANKQQKQAFLPQLPHLPRLLPTQPSLVDQGLPTPDPTPPKLFQYTPDSQTPALTPLPLRDSSPSPSINAPPSMPVLIYIPKSIRPGNTLGPSGIPMGDMYALETDALLLGHLNTSDNDHGNETGNETIVLTHTIFLPLGIWDNILRRVRTGAWKVLETYAVGNGWDNPERLRGHKIRNGNSTISTHQKIHSLLSSAHSFMTHSGANRENTLTKRWRVTRGPMKLIERGAIWEGWGVVLDSSLEIRGEDRKDAVMSAGGYMADETERRKGEIEELLAQYSEDENSENDSMEVKMVEIESSEDEYSENDMMEE